MGDRKTAKAGDTLTAKAGRKLMHALRAQSLDPTECVVGPKSDAKAGQWFCIDCGAFPENNMQAHSHPKSHRLAWRVLASGPVRIEEP